jgi:hypothetical protein
MTGVFSQNLGVYGHKQGSTDAREQTIRHGSRILDGVTNRTATLLFSLDFSSTFAFDFRGDVRPDGNG